MPRSRPAALAIALLVALAGSAHATVRDLPVQFRVVEPIERTGTRVRATIEARLLVPGTFEATSITLPGGATRHPARTPAAPLAAGGVRTFEFEGEFPDPAAQRGTIEGLFDGQPLRWGFDLSRFGADGHHRPGTGELRLADGSVLAPATPEQLALPVQTLERPARTAGALAVPNERDIRLHGAVEVQSRTTDGQRWVKVRVPGVTVKFYDNDFGFLTYLTKTETDENGSYDFNYHWVPFNPLDPDPDIVTEYVLENDNFSIRNPWGLMVYREQTGTYLDVGSDLGGTWRTYDEAVQPAYDILRNLMIGRKWFEQEQGFTLGHVTVYTPEIFSDIGGSGSWYNGLENAIHLGEDRNFDAPTHLHEYGHFFVARKGASLPPDYCNGVCDGTAPWPTPWACGHCRWCTETDHDAWNEGFANVIAEHVTRAKQLGAIYVYEAEDIANCIATGSEGDPWRTEGHFQAAMRDLWDATDSSERASGNSQIWDAMALPISHVVQVAAQDDPVTPAQFFDRYRARYPSESQALYWAQRLAHYPATDVTGPTLPGPVASSSHSFGFPSTNRQLFVTWGPSTDDLSGVRLYHVGIGTSPGAPGTGIWHDWQEGDSLRYHYELPGNGTYYVNVAAIDYEGHEGPYRTSGAIVVRPPDPADLQATLGAGWGAETVARPAADASVNNVPLPTAALPGFATSTYWNFSAYNSGGSATTDSVTAALLLDGATVGNAAWGPIAAGAPFGRINSGPSYVRGGRHTFVTVLDERQRLAEISETNNAFGRQWIWSPFTLTPNTSYLAVAPPPAAAWNGASGTLWYNATGERMTAPAGSWWNLTWVAASDPLTDYDCRLHFATSSPDTGFGSNRGYSARPAGSLDAVLANKNTVGSVNWDVGVLAPSGGTSTFTVRHVTSSSFAFDDSAGVTMPSGEYALVRELYVGPGDLGPVSVVVDHDPARGPVYVGWYDRTFTTGALLSGIVGVSDTTGRARVDLNVASAGFYGVVIWREPRDGSGPLPLAVEMGRTPPDLIPYVLAGWHSAFVPRPGPDGTPASVPLPDTLYGDSSATYLNLALRNESPGPGGAFQAQFDLDGVPTWWLGIGAFGGYATGGHNDGTGFNVRGGRHTLTARYDTPDAVEEIHEDNNAFAEQYVWGPKTVGMETMFLRGGPPDRLGGWLDLPGSAEHWFNADGWRTPRFTLSGSDGYWGAAVVLPWGDADMRLHEVADGSKQGFTTNFAFSGWGPGQTDFSIVNFNRTSLRAFDVGVLGTSSACAFYYAQVVRSRWRGSFPSGFRGPYAFDGATLLHLHEFYLPAGPQVINLAGDSGGIDWGLSVYGPSAASYGKSDALAASWGAPGGLGEGLLANLPSAGYYTVAVWRTGFGGTNDGAYRLFFRSGTTDAPPAAPATTRLAEPRPNPSAGAADLAFTLARTGPVSLAVYDVRGARVRTLAGGTRDAGEHHVRWDGRDDAGGRAAPGIYLVRLEADGIADVRKLVRLD